MDNQPDFDFSEVEKDIDFEILNDEITKGRIMKSIRQHTVPRKDWDLLKDKEAEIGQERDCLYLDKCQLIEKLSTTEAKLEAIREWAEKHYFAVLQGYNPKNVVVFEDLLSQLTTPDGDK